MTIGETIRDYRERKGWKQRELAAAMEMDSSYVSRLESGELNPSMETIMKLTQALDCTPNDLLGFDEPVLAEERA